MAIHVGCTGWSYKDWYKNQFYDKREEERFRQTNSQRVYALWRYSQFFDCSEVNSFNYIISIMEPKELERLGVPGKAVWWYSKQMESVLGNDYQKKQAQKDSYFMLNSIHFTTRRWYDSTPDDFVFTAKVPGMITHAKCLVDCATETRLFLKGIEPVREKMKYLLFEFPSYFTKKDFFSSFKEYFSKMPDNHNYVAEFRSADWKDSEVYDFMRKKKVSLALSEVQDKGVETQQEDVRTTDTTYVRIIGKHGVLTTFDRMELSDAATKTLEKWATAVEKTRNTYVFINNNFAGNAPETANYFKKLLGIKPREWKGPTLQQFF
jgi:uncharacterized protein YecE (DUF72 family)